MKHPILTALAAAVLSVSCAMAATVGQKYIFVDEQAAVSFDGAPDGDVAYGVMTFTEDGVGPRASGIATIKDGVARIPAIACGIHIVTLAAPVGGEARFLAMDVPAPIDEAALRASLPQTAGKLLGGEAFLIAGMGDSVTDTGDHFFMLAQILGRATGNANVTAVRHAYAGRSIDATVRHFDRDFADSHPDLGVLMYGLNDEICFVPRDSFKEQTVWTAAQMRERFGADMLLLQPTPHIETIRTGASGHAEPPEFATRTIDYALAVDEVANELSLPAAATFQAVWGKGENSLVESAIAMWPRYPLGYSQQLSSMIERGGRGDTIHPNALGHYLIARASYEALNGRRAAPALAFAGETHWTKEGLVAHVVASNTTDKARSGRLDAFGPTSAKVAGPVDLAYSLEPGATIEFDVRWLNAEKPEDLTAFPNPDHLGCGSMPFTMVDYANGGSEVQGVRCPFAVAGGFDKSRQEVAGNKAVIPFAKPDGTVESVEVKIPAKEDVGRIPLMKKMRGADGETGWAVADVVYAKVASAPEGEATVDGDLAEWAAIPSFPVGLPCQARSPNGYRDGRESVSEAYIDVRVMAGEKGLYMAFEGTGFLDKDNVNIFFDKRAPELIGTAGPYFWLGMGFKDKGRVHLSQGETSKPNQPFAGAWVETDKGLTAEIFVPYSLFDSETWPEGGDLGLSVIWRHSYEGRSARLSWFENGHEWNSRWYGTVRKGPVPAVPSYVIRLW